MGLRSSLRALRQEKGWTQEQLAEKLGVARSTVTQWESGWSQPRMGMVVKLSNLFGVSPSVFVDGGVADDMEMERLPEGFFSINPVPTVPIPVVDHVHAGMPTDPDEADYILDVPETIIKPGSDYVGCIVDGDCMDKIYPEDCLIVVRLTPTIPSGVIGVFRIDGYQTVMRRVYRGANTLILSPESYNPEHKDIVITEESGKTVEALGVVEWFQAKQPLA